MDTSPSIGSNNPFRHSFGASPSQQDSQTPTPTSLCPPCHPLQKTSSTTTTIMEEDESEAMHYTQPITLSRTASCEPPPTPPPNAPLPQLPPNALILDGSKNGGKRLTGEGNGDGHILITIHSRDSQTSTPPHTAGLPTHKMSMDASQQQNCNMWPALRFAQKAKFKSKRRFIAMKVAIAVVIVIGAVAVGLGISKAVNDGKNN